MTKFHTFLLPDYYLFIFGRDVYNHCTTDLTQLYNIYHDCHYANKVLMNYIKACFLLYSSVTIYTHSFEQNDKMLLVQFS